MSADHYTPPPAELRPGSTVWAYLRDSGGPTQDRSVDQQREVLIEYCQRHGLTLDRIFADVHKTGTSDESRDEFLEMADLTIRPANRPHGILFWSSARIARNTIDAQYHRATLRKRGIIIHALIDDIPAGKFQIAFESILDVTNQEKAEQASREAKRGLESIVKNHGAVPGTPPRGFMRVPIETVSTDGVKRTLHRWEPDPEAVPRVRQAFEMRVAGRSLAEINAATGLYGSINSYRTFWSNKLYIGILEFGDLVIDNYCEPIIDRETWDTVQEISQKFTQHQHMKDELHHPRRTASSFLLSGLCRCGRCGSAMHGQASPQRNGSRIESYRCNNSHSKRDCDLPRIPAQFFEKTVIETLITAFSQPEIYIELHHQADAKRATWVEKQLAKRQDLEASLRGLRKAARNYTEAIGKMGYSKTIADQLVVNERQQTSIELQLRELRSATPSQKQAKTDEQLAAQSLLVAQLLRSDDRQTVRDIIQGLIYEVHIDRDGPRIFGVITVGTDDDDPGTLPKPRPPGYNPPNDNDPNQDEDDAVGKTLTPVGALSVDHMESMFHVVFLFL